MKKIWVIFVVFGLMLTGCGAEETFETIADEVVQQVSVQVREIALQLPEEAASPTVESGANRLYQCRDYDISIQTLDGGDLNRTIQTLSGYEKESLTVIQTERSGVACYEFVWASVGETGDQIGRAVILDDGSYHYCVSILGDADAAAANQVYWDELFHSVTLS